MRGLEVSRNDDSRNDKGIQNVKSRYLAKGRTLDSTKISGNNDASFDYILQGMRKEIPRLKYNMPPLSVIHSLPTSSDIRVPSTKGFYSISSIESSEAPLSVKGEKKVVLQSPKNAFRM